MIRACNICADAHVQPGSPMHAPAARQVWEHGLRGPLLSQSAVVLTSSSPLLALRADSVVLLQVCTCMRTCTMHSACADAYDRAYVHLYVHVHVHPADPCMCGGAAAGRARAAGGLVAACARLSTLTALSSSKVLQPAGCMFAG